jgi:DNA-binding helix-hairpin-helix protein with protein kinase domain
MPLIVSTETNQQISLTDQPFASGGEGELYKVISPNSLSNYCVKIFYSQYQTQKKAEKLRFMIKNKPDSVGNDNDISICWPVDLIFIQSGFVGFLMPLAFNDSIQLYELCTPKLKKNLSAIWHQKFDRSHDESVKNRIKLCINLAIAIFNIHKVGNYVLVDMKPQNILITADGKVSIVDLDSIQIANKTQVIHNGHVATPEYTPPEGAKLNPSTDYIPETWDRFSLAVIYYELLFGVHPFVSTSTRPYEHISTIDE